MVWNRSSQAEWVIRCEHCNKFNIPNPEQDLLKMIGKRGPVCAKCGQPVFPKNGGYVHARPERQLSFPGYHISQTVHPLHILSQVLSWTDTPLRTRRPAADLMEITTALAAGLTTRRTARQTEAPPGK